MSALILQESDSLLWERLKGIASDSVCVTRTDTIYGLGCRYDNAHARERILQIKGRIDPKFIVLVSGLAQAKSLCEISDEQIRMIEQYWPAAISFVLKGRGTEPTLALRQPKLPFAQSLLTLFGGAMVSTSCNVSGTPTVENITQAIALFGDKVDFYIDGGTLVPTQASTVVDLTTNPPQVLRAGAVPFP